MNLQIPRWNYWIWDYVILSNQLIYKRKGINEFANHKSEVMNLRISKTGLVNKFTQFIITLANCNVLYKIQIVVSRAGDVQFWWKPDGLKAQTLLFSSVIKLASRDLDIWRNAQFEIMPHNTTISRFGFFGVVPHFVVKNYLSLNICFLWYCMPLRGGHSNETDGLLYFIQIETDVPHIPYE